MPRTVLALGGNAFASATGRLTMAGQFRFAHEVLAGLGPLLDDELVVTHGNGPQVGHMLVRVEQALGVAYEIPLEVCVAETEGELGYVLLQSLHNVLAERGTPRSIASLITQVVVDASDPAFGRPSKPRAEALRAAGFAVVEDSGRGYRRVVASPEPVELVDAGVIARLLELGAVVIAAGGGGIPVVREGVRLRGVDAVIDKDRASALLAQALGASSLVILTGVPQAYLFYGTPAQRGIDRATPARALAWLGEGHFAPGSMGPKIEAAARFAAQGGRALICDPASLPAALEGRAGTWIEEDT